MSKHLWFFLFLVFITVAISASAQSEDTDEIVLEGIEMLGTKETVNHITQEQMRLHNAVDLGEALMHSPGVNFEISGHRNESQVNIRGFDHRQIPIFIDGIPIYVPYDWSSDLARILTEDIESIDLSKGYSSALLGANTLGGAINLRMSKPRKAAEAHLRYGHNFDNQMGSSAYFLSAAAGTKQPLYYAKMNFAYHRTNFFRLPDSFEAVRYEDGGRRENSASEDKKISLMAGWTPTENFEWLVGYVYQRGEKEQPTDAAETNPMARFWRWPFWNKDSLYSTVQTLLLNGALTLKVTAYYDTYENSMVEYSDATFTNHIDPSDYDDYTVGGKFESGYEFNSKNRLQLALSYKYDSHKVYDGGVFTEKMEDETYSAAFEYTVKPFTPLTVIVGGGYDTLKAITADEEFGKLPLKSAESITGGFALIYDITDRHEIGFSFAQKTRMPTMKERYGGNTTVKNPDLNPEEAFHYELAYKGYLLGKSNISAALFYSKANDLIERRDLISGSNQYLNVSEVSFYGAELGGEALFGDLVRIGSAASYLRWENLEGTEKLTYKPRFRGELYAVIMPTDGLSIVPKAEYTASFYSDSNGSEVDGFALAHLKAVYDINDYLGVEAGVKNIFDKLYEYSVGFPQSGRVYFIGLAAKI
jgi:iron complex outermembrane receptor protein